jgi:hypothetical protein
MLSLLKLFTCIFNEVASVELLKKYILAFYVAAS